jgi:hypothetical protein
MTHFGQPWSTYGQTLVKDPLNTFDPSLSPGTFAAFSKFRLNTSKSPNVKVVYFVEGHNFHIEWHWRCGVEMHENAWSTLKVTIHRHPGNLHLGMRFVHNRLRKIPHGLCRSCSWSCDLQLWLLALCAL